MTTQIAVRLPDDLVEAIDVLIGPSGPANRTELIRDAVVAHVQRLRDSQIDAAIVEGYRRVPPATPDEWGDVAAASDRAAVETAQRLDLEEADAGHPSW